MIKRAGYEAESHFVTTEDGYIIEIHRIPGRVGSTPVFLQHGLFGSSNTWVLTGKNHSLGMRKFLQATLFMFKDIKSKFYLLKSLFLFSLSLSRRRIRCLDWKYTWYYIWESSYEYDNERSTFF